MEVQNDLWPSEVRLSPDKRTLKIEFEGGASFDLSAEYLRVESPSAEVQGHSPAEKKTIAGKRNIRIMALEPVGNYALKLRFDDGHDTGIFTWRYFFDLGQQFQTKWNDYLDRLNAAGLQRD